MPIPVFFSFLFFFALGCHPNFEIVSFNADIVDPEEKKAEETENPGLQWELDGTNNLRPCHSCQPLTTLTQNKSHRWTTSLDLKSETFRQTGDRCDEEEYLTQMMLSLALEPENVPINDNLENLPSNFHDQERVGGIGPLDSPGKANFLFPSLHEGAITQISMT